MKSMQWKQALAWSAVVSMAACSGTKQAVIEEPVDQPKTRVIKPRELVASANEKMEQGDYEGALTDLNTVLDKQPGNSVALYNRALIYQKQGEWQKAQSDYEAVLQATPDDRQAALNLGAVYVELGKKDKAVALYEKQLEDDEFNPDLLNNLSVLHREQKEYDEAIQAVRKLLMRDKENVDAYKNLALVYQDQGKLKLAETILDNARRMSKEQNRSDPDIYVNLGMIYLSRKENGRAMAAFKEALKLDPDHLEANYNVGGLALSHRDYGMAEASYSKVAEKLPTSEKVATYLAHSYQGQQKYEDAMKQFERAVELTEKKGQKVDEQMYVYLMTCATGANDPDKGLQYCDLYQKKSGVQCNPETDFEGVCGKCTGFTLMKQMAEEAAAAPPPMDPEGPKATGRDIFTEDQSAEDAAGTEEAAEGETPVEGEAPALGDAPTEGDAPAPE